jgi:hypothetical protein
MLVDLSKTEQEIMNSIRESEKYKSGNFHLGYVEFSAELRRLVDAAKVYILDNYQKVENYSELNLMLRAANHDKTCYFGQRRKTEDDIKINSAFHRIWEELDAQTIEIKSFDKAVFDWTDGDFSVVFNGVNYNWIDSNSIVDIADYIESRLKTK